MLASEVRNAMSIALLMASVPLAFVSPWLSIALFCVPPMSFISCQMTAGSIEFWRLRTGRATP